jgi:hypothetical protein
MQAHRTRCGLGWKKRSRLLLLGSICTMGLLTQDFHISNATRLRTLFKNFIWSEHVQFLSLFPIYIAFALY